MDRRIPRALRGLVGGDTSLTDKRIVIVCGHFSPEIGYQEVSLARAFARLGAAVRVVTSTELSPNARTVLRHVYKTGSTQIDGYEVVRLKPRLSLGPNLLGRDVRRSVSQFDPTHTILVGPGKLFGTSLFSAESQSWRRIAVVQDNSEDGRSRDAHILRGTRAAAHRLVKRPIYRRVVRHADRIILNVPESRGLIEPWLGPDERGALYRKGVELRLGFDPEQFFFDRAARRQWRTTQSIATDEVVLATCTRATPSKRLEEVIDAVSALRTRGLPVRYALAGLLDDEYAGRLRAHAADQPDPSAFLLFPTLLGAQVREFFCAADVGFWPRAAITIQQAMGTGLPVALRRRANVTHLLAPGQNGWYLEQEEPLDQGLARGIADLMTGTEDVPHADRRKIAGLNRAYLSYDVIAETMVSGL